MAKLKLSAEYEKKGAASFRAAVAAVVAALVEQSPVPRATVAGIIIGAALKAASPVPVFESDGIAALVAGLQAMLAQSDPQPSEAVAWIAMQNELINRGIKTVADLRNAEKILRGGLWIAPEPTNPAIHAAMLDGCNCMKAVLVGCCTAADAANRQAQHA